MIELMGKEISLRRLAEGDGEIAEVNMIVRCHLKGYYYSTTEHTRLRETPFEILENIVLQIGEGDVIPGLELALRHSKVGDHLLVNITSRFAFGDGGKLYNNEWQGLPLDALAEGVVPPNMDVQYEVTILSHTADQELLPDMQERFEKITSSIVDDTDKAIVLNRLKVLQGLQMRKDCGNRWFVCKEFGRAAKAYSRATKLADTYFNKEHDEKVSLAQTLEEKAQALHEKENREIDQDDLEVVSVYVTCLNNLVACKLSQGEYKEAKELCVRVLEADPGNVKALIRAVKASLALDLFDECEACLKFLDERKDLQESQVKEVVTLRNKLRKARVDYKEKSRQLQQKIAAGLFNAPSKAKNKEEKRNVGNKDEGVPAIDLPPAKPVDPEPAAPAAAQAKEVEVVESKSSPLNANVIMLLGTSLAVLLVSVIFAYLHR